MSQLGVLLRLPPTPTVGFDLDLTLIDSTQATRFALQLTNRQLGLSLDVEAVLAQLGAPFREVFGEWVAEPRLTTALRHFYRVFESECLSLMRAIPGAQVILDELRRAGGRSVVITGRRDVEALECLAQQGLRVDAVVGGVIGLAKVPAMRQQRVDVFVGDHELDMIGARSAGVPAVGLLSGAHDEPTLRAAGATVVLTSVAALTSLFP